MDPLRADDLARARATSPGEKLVQALDMMRAGFALKRAALRVRFPSARQEEIDARFRRWLEADEVIEPPLVASRRTLARILAVVAE